MTIYSCCRDEIGFVRIYCIRGEVAFPIKCVLIFVQVDEPLNLASQQQNQAIASYLNVHLKILAKIILMTGTHNESGLILAAG